MGPATGTSQADEAHVRARTGWMTAEDLLHLPDDGCRHELIRGKLKRMAPAGNRHGRLAANVAASLWIHVRAHGLGTVYAAETGYRLASDPDHVRAPDASFISRERLERTGKPTDTGPERRTWRSKSYHPATAGPKSRNKVRNWLDAGARMVVVVDSHPGRTVRIHHPPSLVSTLTEDDVIDGGDVVPDWRLPVRKMFDS